MGKLTGPSSKPLTSGEPQAVDGEENATNIAAPVSTDPSPNISSEKVAQMDNNDHKKGGKAFRLALKSKRLSQRSNSSNSRLTESMVSAVNDAAKTAMLVLDHAATTDIGDDNRSMSSRGSRRLSDAGSISSVMSGGSRGSSMVPDGLGFETCMDYQVPLAGVGGTEGLAEVGNEEEGNGFNRNGSEPTGSDNSLLPLEGEDTSTAPSFIVRSESESANVPAFTPPPMAFQNLPMTRGFTPSHNKSNKTNGDSNPEGRVFEIHNHTDTASALSAALANSGTRGFEGLKIPKPARAGLRRRSSDFLRSSTLNADVDASSSRSSRLRRSLSGDSYQTPRQSFESDPIPSNHQSSGLPTPQEAAAAMMSNRSSWMSTDDLDLSNESIDERVSELLRGSPSTFDSSEQSIEDGDNRPGLCGHAKGKAPKPSHSPNNMKESRGQVSPSRRRANLPTKEEAEAAMLSKRTSFTDDDMSFEKDMDCVGVELKKFADEQKVGDIKTSSEKKDPAELKGERERTKSEDESNSSVFENESNTSSISIGSSDISPMTTSTMGGSGATNKEGGRNNASTVGMLGNLANMRRGEINDTEHSYDVADDEYSTQSENTRQGRLTEAAEGALPRRSSENKNTKAKSTAAKPANGKRNITPGILKPQSKRPLDSSSDSQTGDSVNSSSTSTVRGSNTPSSSGKKVQFGHQMESSFEQLKHAAPAHHTSLFESFDRNWEQAVQGAESPEKLLDLGRKCFVSFAIVFGSHNSISGRPIFVNSANNGVDGGNVCWWDDDNALTRFADSGNTAAPVDGHLGIPIVVVRTLWKACFFDSVDDAEVILDSIEQTLVKELCYLTSTTSSSTPCLRLSLDVYNEYGWYILRRFGLQDQINCWHSKLSSLLRQLLLNGSGHLIERRYAAQSLPKHTALGLLDVNSDGEFQLEDADEKRVEISDQLLGLLSDEQFIKARVDLLGRGGVVSGHTDGSSDSDGEDQLVALIEQNQSNDNNMLYSTMIHMSDIEWSASFCSLDLNGYTGDIESGPRNFDWLDTINQWREVLVTLYNERHNSGKLTVSENPSKDEGGSGSETENYIEVVEGLLSTDDAWTMKDDALLEFSSPRPPRKGRRKRSDSSKSATTSLAHMVSINITDLRTSVSIGRSLVGLSEFAQYMQDKDSSKKEKSITKRFRSLHSSSLKSAIEILSSTATTLGYILSSSLDELDEDDLDDLIDSTCGPPRRRKKSLGPASLVQLFAVTKEASKPLLFVAGILSASAWFSLAVKTNLAHKVDASSAHAVLCSFERALLILNSPKSTHLNKAALDNLCESLLSPLTRSKSLLQSNINHAVGVYLYECAEFDRSADYLDKSSLFRRRLLDDIRNGNPSDIESDNEISGLSELYTQVVGGIQSNYSASSTKMSKVVFTNVFTYSIKYGCNHLPSGIFKVDDMELNLSLTLEYSALTQHASQKYQLALSFFQESLILRTMHVGKSSLDVASLHFNMGVVYDDLEQYDQAISRYHESLRIRLEQLSTATIPARVAELEDSVLLTLKCMGHVYKLVKDIDNAICCYVKALEMVNKKYLAHQEPADEWSKMGMRLGLAVPVPTISIDEMKSSNTNWKSNFQMMNKKELCWVFEPKGGKRRSKSSVSKLKKELARLHSSVMDLVQERKQNAWDNESTSFKSNKLPGTSSLLLASLSASLKMGGDAFEAALMRSSFALGRMRLGQMRYEEAADYLETSLRSKWVLDPASSSDSDSDFSFKSLSSLRQKSKTMDEDDPEEGQIYYALGVCNAAMDDHERAVRCFLTSMRYLRRSLRKVDSLEVARVLFDCATSHYYLCNFEQSVTLYEECLRILKSYDGIPPHNEKEDDASVSSNAGSYRQGVVLYCLVMASSFSPTGFDAELSNLLNEAQILLSYSNDQVILAYMEFLTGIFLLHAAEQVPARLRSITKISSNGLSLNDGLSWNEMCKSALALLEQVKNECWFDPHESVEDPDEVRHLPLSGHICFVKGQVYELIDSVDQALSAYVDAANFYRIACGDENMYVASVLHRMGMICSVRTEFHALGYFNEALSIKKDLLGDDHLVAETLYASANVLSRLGKYEASMERYHEALRLQMADSQDSSEVARTLGGMGICHYNHRAHDLALTCLEGAVKIRKYRVSRLTDSADLVELYGEECALATDFFNLGNIHMQMGDHAQAMQCFIQSRDLRWTHVGSGTVNKILDKYLSETTVDEDELLGLAHCLHNIGAMFDFKKEYARSLPHYEEALAIKNAIAGFNTKDSMSVVQQMNVNENEALVLQSLNKDEPFPRINKATLSASVTRHKIAAVYVKQKKYDHALFHFSHALRIQRQVLGKDHFRVGSILTSMANALQRSSSKPPEMAVLCYNESLRISRLRFGQNHVSVASALYDIGNLHDSNKNFGKAMDYYQRSLNVYRQKYFQNLRRRLCSGGFDRPIAIMNEGNEDIDFLSSSDEIADTDDPASSPEKKIKEQYALVTNALRRAKRQDMLKRGEMPGCIGDTNDAWLAFEILLFRFMEMLSTWIVDPAQRVVHGAVDKSRQKIEAAAVHAIISASDAIDYQFLLDMQR